MQLTRKRKGTTYTWVGTYIFIVDKQIIWVDGNFLMFRVKLHDCYLLKYLQAK